VHPVGRWIWLLKDLAGPARVDGSSKTPVQFREISTSTITRAAPDATSGKLRLLLPQGEYEVTAGTRKQLMTVLAGDTYSLDLSSASYLDVGLSREAGPSGTISIRARVSGSGDHTLSIRSDNLTIEQPVRRVTLHPGAPQTLEWQAKPASPGSPWIAVVIPDDQVSLRRELTGR
jgi:hypothetical protein